MLKTTKLEKYTILKLPSMLLVSRFLSLEALQVFIAFTSIVSRGAIKVSLDFTVEISIELSVELFAESSESVFSLIFCTNKWVSL